jgi:hypothetical protein
MNCKDANALEEQVKSPDEIQGDDRMNGRNAVFKRFALE